MNIVEEPKTESELEKILNKNYKFKRKNKINCLKISNYFLNYGLNINIILLFLIVRVNFWVKY